MSTAIPAPRADSSLVRVTRKLATEALGHEAIERAKAAAEALAGVVVTDDRAAADVADRLSAVKRGQKAAKAALDGVITPHKECIDEARHVFREITTLLDQAESGAKTALVSYQQEQERKVRAERERREREAREAAERQRAEKERLEREAREAAAAAAKAEGEKKAELARAAAAASAAAAQIDEEAPPMEPEPVAPPTGRVYGRRGFAHQTSVLKVEMLDPSAVATFDPTLLELRTAAACAAYRAATERGETVAAPPHPSGGVVWCGMRFYREQSIAAR